MTRYSILDLAPVPQGLRPGDAIRNTIDLARHAERLGYTRYWLAEHHNMPASPARRPPSSSARWRRRPAIRVGSGGIMLPNHAPLVIAEQFGTLEALFPGRIDLGLGRAPGTDQLTPRALRRNLDGAPTTSRRTWWSCRRYLAPAEPGQRVPAVPGRGQQVPLWILGSSLFGAQLAAMLGLPYAFASHFAPDAADAGARRSTASSSSPRSSSTSPYAMPA